MTRWKRERCAIVHTMYAHNHWSNYAYRKLDYITARNIPLGVTAYPIHDGSWVQEWYVPASCLEKLGGRGGLSDLVIDEIDKESRKCRAS